MMAGQKIIGIFGFCDIRNFTDATEVLQTRVMVFVNQVAEVVHSQVDKYGGSANKNIGDAFLLAWKFQDVDLIDENGEVALKTKSKRVSIMADLSVFSFIKIIAKINKMSHLLEYRKEKALCERLGGQYKVRMGFGLHLGWAIEGTIGSEFKIDASYLSPNVNIAARLEAATKQYGVPLLYSGELHDILSPKMRKIAREIDCVTVKGSVKPMKFYTVTLQEDDMAEM
jgi:class 3 adenylate cyclase